MSFSHVALAGSALALSVAVAMPSVAGEPKSIQSNFTVFGLPHVGPVLGSGSDARAQRFNRDILPGATELVREHLREQVEFRARGVTRLDEDMLFFLARTTRPVRVYYIHEGAMWRNSIGYSATRAGSDQAGYRKLVFPDVSDGTWGGPRILTAGDFVELGHFAAGTQLEFFIVSDAVNGGRHVFSNQDNLNSDGMQHLAAWLLGDQYVLLGFEDVPYGGDLDYNDVVVVVDFGADLKNGPLALPR